MASATSLMAEIRGSAGVIQARAAIGADPDRLEAVKTALANSLKHMIHSVNQVLTSAQVAELMEAVGHTLFAQEKKDELCLALEAKLVASRVEPRLGSTECQKFANGSGCILSYLTARDWLGLQDRSVPWNAQEKVDIVLRRLSSGGFWKPALPAAADCVAALASSAWDDSITAVDLYNCVKTFMAQFRERMELGIGLPVVRVWPTTPDQLPNVVKSKMYPDADDQPLTVPCPLWAQIRKKVSCKDINKNVRADFGKEPAARPALTDCSAASMAHGLFGAAQPPNKLASLDVTAFLQTAQACGISHQQAFQLGAQMLQSGQLGSSGISIQRSGSQPSTFQCEDLTDAGVAPLSGQLAAVRRNQSPSPPPIQLATGSPPSSSDSQCSQTMGSPPVAPARSPSLGAPSACSGDAPSFSPLGDTQPAPTSTVQQQQQQLQMQQQFQMHQQFQMQQQQLQQQQVVAHQAPPEQPSEAAERAAPPNWSGALSEFGTRKANGPVSRRLSSKSPSLSDPDRSLNDIKQMEAAHHAQMDEARRRKAEAAALEARDGAMAAGGDPGAPAGGQTRKGPTRKRPAAAPGRAAKAQKPDPAQHDPTLGEVPPMPAQGPVWFLNGKLSPSEPRKGWRIWPDRRNVAWELSVKFGDVPREESYKAALLKIKEMTKGKVI